MLIVCRPLAVRLGLVWHQQISCASTFRDFPSTFATATGHFPLKTGSGSARFQGYGFRCSFLLAHCRKNLQEITLPETNSKSTRKWMVGIRLFPFGMAYFQGRTVSFREDMNLSILRPFKLIQYHKMNRSGMCWPIWQPLRTQKYLSPFHKVHLKHLYPKSLLIQFSFSHPQSSFFFK